MLYKNEIEGLLLTTHCISWLFMSLVMASWSIIVKVRMRDILVCDMFTGL